MRSGLPAFALRILTEVLMTLATGHVRRIRRSLIADCPTSPSTTAPTGHGNTMTRSDDCVDLAHERLSGGLRLDRDDVDVDGRQL